MLTFNQLLIDEIPILEIVPAEYIDKPLPLVVYYHGWTNNKDYSIAYAIEVAKKGFRVVTADALYHGERRLKGQEKDQDIKNIIEIIPQSVREFPKIISHYQDLIKEDFIGVAGNSMGGITVCMLIAEYDQIKTGVCLEGSPASSIIAKEITGLQKVPEIFEKLDLSKRPELIKERSMMFWHAQDDQWVDVSHVHDFYHDNVNITALKYTYLSEDEGGEHFVPFSEVRRMAIFLKNVYTLPKETVWQETSLEIEKLYGNVSE